MQNLIKRSWIFQGANLSAIQNSETKKIYVGGCYVCKAHIIKFSGTKKEVIQLKINHLPT